MLLVVVLDFSPRAGLPFGVVAPQSFHAVLLPDNNSQFFVIITLLYYKLDLNVSYSTFEKFS